jgi:thiamine-monophosphate kinase
MTEDGLHKLTMGDVGEKGFLRKLLPTLEKHPTFVNGFGDDASAIRIGNDKLLFFKVDRAAAPMAARKGWTDYKMWGRLAVTSNCSDILTDGGKPVSVMIGMILPRDWSVQAAIEAIQGCAEECASNDIAFAGGDTKEGKSPELVGSAVGLGRDSQLLTRHAANPGDLIVVAGELGGFLGSYLQIVKSLEGDTHDQNFESWRYFVAHPRARWAEAELIRSAGVATAAMDTSDGIYDAVATLTSNYGADMYLDSFPYHEIAYECARRLDVSVFNLGLGVGDWNIVYTVSADKWEDFQSQLTSSSVSLTVVGKVSETIGIRWHDSPGKVFRCTPVVNEHFAARLEDESSSLLDRLKTQNMLHAI